MHLHHFLFVCLFVCALCLASEKMMENEMKWRFKLV
jgi:hypothetical protein